MHSLLLFLVVLLISPLNAGEFTLLVPINAKSKPRIQLQVKIPPGFKSIQPMESFEAQTQFMIEFIPENEDPDQWSEIITVFKYIGIKVSAPTLVERVKNSFMDKTKAEVISESITSFKNYKHAALTLEYIYQNQMEVLGMLYDSGPYDCSGVQYTIRPPKGQSSDQSVKKIQNFFNTNTQTIEF